MTRTIVSLLFIFYAAIALGQTVMHVPSNFPLSQSTLGTRFDDIDMINDSVGFVVTQSGIIIKTENRWGTYSIVDTLRGYGRSVHFMNEQVGICGDLTGGMQYTTDGGDHWYSPLAFAYLGDTVKHGVDRGICGIDSGDSTLYLCGKYSGEAFMLKANIADFTSWQFIDMRQYASALVDVYFLSSDTGFVTGTSADPMDGAIILHTTDGGLHWNTVYQSHVANDLVWKIQQVNDTLYFASIESFLNPVGTILKSVDGGQVWQEITIDTVPDDVQMVGFIDENIGFVGGHFDGYYQTADGGQTWEFHNENTVGNFNRFLKGHDNTYWISGGGIFRVDGPDVGTVKLEQPKFSISVVPNPSRGDCSIKLDLDRNTGGYIFVYDASGKIFYRTPNRDFTQGVEYFQINTHGWAQGKYFVSLVCHHGQYSTSLIVE